MRLLEILRRTEPLEALEALPEKFSEYMGTPASSSSVLNFTPNLSQFLPQTDLKAPKLKNKDSIEPSLKSLFLRWLRADLNCRPWAYESPALTN